MTMLSANNNGFSWASYNEDTASYNEESMTIGGLSEQISITKDSTDYLRYTTEWVANLYETYISKIISTISLSDQSGSGWWVLITWREEMATIFPHTTHTHKHPYNQPNHLISLRTSCQADLFADPYHAYNGSWLLVNDTFQTILIDFTFINCGCRFVNHIPVYQDHVTAKILGWGPSDE